MNDWGRDELIDALEPHEVAEHRGTARHDDAVAMIEDMEEDEQRPSFRALDPDDRAAIEEALTFPRNPPVA
jgi:magnesium transporter